MEKNTKRHCSISVTEEARKAAKLAAIELGISVHEYVSRLILGEKPRKKRSA